MNARILCALFGLVAWGGPLLGQGRPGTNLSVTVRVRTVTISGDTTTVSYSPLNAATSVERLMHFFVLTPTPLVSISRPSPSSDWMALTAVGDSAAAFWAAIATIAPGDSMATLTFRAIGLPGILSAWYRGDSLPEMSTDTTDDDPLVDQLVKIQTVGIEAAPTSLAALVTRLHVLSDSACALGWITNGSLCSALGGDLSAAPTKVLTFTTSLDSANAHGSDVGASAYGLLKPNAEYIKAFIDIPAISLTNVCGGVFRARNFSYPSITMGETDQYGAHPVTLPARTADGPGYADLTIYGSTAVHPTYPLTVTLSYGGSVVKTATGSGPDC